MHAALYSSLQKHNAAIKALDARAKRYQETINELEKLLNDLESGYNPNYVDMAVINTVKAWKGMKGVEEKVEGEEEQRGEQKKEGDQAEDEDEESEEDKEDAKWTEWEVSQLQRTDYVSLMLEHEKHLAQANGDQVKSLRKWTHVDTDSQLTELQCIPSKTISQMRFFRPTIMSRTRSWLH